MRSVEVVNYSAAIKLSIKPVAQSLNDKAKNYAMGFIIHKLKILN